MASCSQCGKDVNAFALFDAATGKGKCDPCVTGIAAPAIPSVPPYVAPKTAYAQKKPSPVAHKPEPKPEPKPKKKK